MTSGVVDYYVPFYSLSLVTLFVFSNKDRVITMLTPTRTLLLVVSVAIGIGWLVCEHCMHCCRSVVGWVKQCCVAPGLSGWRTLYLPNDEDGVLHYSHKYPSSIPSNTLLGVSGD